MSTPTMKGMEAVLRKFKKSTCDEVNGVIRIDGPKPEHVLGITACTHGNEPTGLVVFNHLLNEEEIRKILLKGVLFLVVNNIAACEKYFAAVTDKEIVDARFVHINMNRLPLDRLAMKTDTAYELVRARELFPIWEQFTHGLDIHSTLMPDNAVIISRGGVFYPNLVRGFPINLLLSNIDVVQMGKPAFSFYGGADTNTPVFAIEAGQHTDPASFQRGVACTLSLLKNLEMIEGEVKTAVSPYQEYLIDGSVIFPDMSFDFITEFKSYDEVKEGEVLARGAEGAEILAPFDGLLMMPTSKRGKAKDISEEVAFLSRSMKIRTV